MNVDTSRRFRWPIIAAVLGVILAAVFLVTGDVIWTLVPLLLTIAAVRRLARSESGRESPEDRMQD